MKTKQGEILKYLYVYPISGLYEELYNPNPEEIKNKLYIKGNCIKPNGLFWYKIFNPENLKTLIKELEIYAKNNVEILPQFMAVLSNREKFICNVQKSIIEICEQGKDFQSLFKNIETLNIVVELYNTFACNKIKLSLQDGYLCEDQNYQIISDTCLLKKHNPYLEIINKHIVPTIIEQNPDIVFLVGKINCFNVAIAKLLKVKKTKIKICLSRHSSEYYSLSKISNYLLMNDLLFSDIDYVILEQFRNTEKLLINAIEQNQNVNLVPNLIYREHNNTVVQTATCSNYDCNYCDYTLRSPNRYKFNIDPTKIADVCLAPYSKCYWNKCTFCGINHKYLHDYKELDYKDYIKIVDRLVKDLPQIKYYWFIDEALTITQLLAIADSFIKSKKEIFWQARTRIDKKLLAPELIEILKKSGLIELRLGLESASYTVLRKMNKFDESFSLNLVKNIIKEYSKNNISIHFPIIVGFPGETDYDRKLTYDFLTEMKAKYPLVTFNINILNLDVSSQLFKKWYNFEINSVSLPCNPKFFLGNVAEYTCDISSKSNLEKERNDFMREQLYPWYPIYALTKPIVFYRLSESSRNTLTVKSIKKTEITKNQPPLYVLDPEIVFYHFNNGFLVYNFTTHHYMRCSKSMIRIIAKFKTPQNIKEVKTFWESECYTSDDIDVFLNRLIEYGYIVSITN